MKTIKTFFLIMGVLIPSLTFSQTKGTEYGHEWVDLGLSVKWATCNLGASSPSDFGDYIAFGESSSKSTYNARNSLCFQKHQSDISGTSSDAAKSRWGGNWRIPTLSEVKELMETCTWDWTTIDGHSGYKITGLNGNSIFLPASGGKSDDKLFDRGSFGAYWSSTPKDREESYTINFNSEDYGWSADAKFGGIPIRPVMN